jgi:flagellar hook-associated protein 3 FlgL
MQDMINAFNTTGLSINASINSIGKGISIENTDPTRTLIIEDVTESKPAKFLGISGSPDVMGNLMVLMEALRNDDAEAINSVIEGLDRSIDETLNNRASAGAKIIRLQTTEVRLTEYSLEFTKLLSEVEDADITRLVADLAQQENIYLAALQAASKIIQPSLLNFLR